MPAPADGSEDPQRNAGGVRTVDRAMRRRMIPSRLEMVKRHYAAALFRGCSPFADKKGVHWRLDPDDHETLDAIRKVLGREIVDAAVDALRKNWLP